MKKKYEKPFAEVQEFDLKDIMMEGSAQKREGETILDVDEDSDPDDE